MVSALFVQKKSVYKDLGIDSWDEDRDARKFDGTWPVVAHPPCRLWSRMRGLSTAPAEEKLLAVFAVEIVRKNGGVLEHPASSTLWMDQKLPQPKDGVDCFGGFSICINQSWWGHKAEKKTLLYICGLNHRDLPPIPYKLDAIQFTVGSMRRTHHGKKSVSKFERSATPKDFALWLIEVASKCKTPGLPT